MSLNERIADGYQAKVARRTPDGNLEISAWEERTGDHPRSTGH